MYNKNKYVNLVRKQEKEFNDFPMFFAYNEKQYKEGKQTLGIIDDKDICYIGYCGCIRKKDLQAFNNMIEKHKIEIKQSIENDKTGEGFIYDMFLYELENHEYFITYEIDDTLDALNLTIDEVLNSSTLKNGLLLARKKILEENRNNYNY